MEDLTKKRNLNSPTNNSNTNSQKKNQITQNNEKETQADKTNETNDKQLRNSKRIKNNTTNSMEKNSSKQATEIDLSKPSTKATTEKVAAPNQEPTQNLDKEFLLINENLGTPLPQVIFKLKQKQDEVDVFLILQQIEEKTDTDIIVPKSKLLKNGTELLVTFTDKLNFNLIHSFDGQYSKVTTNSYDVKKELSLAIQASYWTFFRANYEEEPSLDEIQTIIRTRVPEATILKANYTTYGINAQIQEETSWIQVSNSPTSFRIKGSNLPILYPIPSAIWTSDPKYTKIYVKGTKFIDTQILHSWLLKNNIPTRITGQVEDKQTKKIQGYAFIHIIGNPETVIRKHYSGTTSPQ